MPDPKKLRAFQEEHSDDNPGPEDEVVHQEEVPAEEDISEESQNQRKMDPAVAYMELDQEAGAFSCGTCVFGMPMAEEKDSAACMHPQVRAQVSAKFGCCNFFAPVDDIGVVFPPQAGEKPEEEEEEPEEEPEEEEEEEPEDDED